MKINKLKLLLPLLYFLQYAICNGQTLTDSLVGYYTFNNDLNDYSGNENTILTAEGAFTIDRFGELNSAFHFDGVNDSLVLPITEFSPVMGDFTISFWYKTNSSSIMNLFSSKQSPIDTTQNFEIQLNSHNSYYLSTFKQLWYQTFVYWNGSGVDSNAIAEGVAGNFIKGDWCHFAITRSADTFKIHRDHVLYYLSLEDFDDNILGDAVDLIFSASPYPFKGDIDDLRLYDRALSQSEIDQLWFENDPIKFVSPASTDAYVQGSQVLVFWEYDITQISDSIQVNYRINNGEWIPAIHSNLAWENYSYIDMNYLPGTTVEFSVHDIADTSIHKSTGTFEVSPYNWTEVASTLPFPAKDGAGLVVFDNKMWLLGGWDPPFHEPDFTHNEVWNSTDGINWDFIGNAPWPARHCTAWLSDNASMYVIGGDPQSGCLTDVWKTTDGENWSQVIDAIPGYTQRNMPNYAMLDNKITLYGGEQCSGNGLQDVWQSEDGFSWTQLPDAPWSGRGMQLNNCVDNSGTMWMLGGANEGERRPFNEVWNTNDGINWNLINASAPWVGRYWHTVAWYDNKLWVMGGITSGIELNDVWYSEDGLNWLELKSTTGNWPAGTRHAQSTTVYDNALWYMCGINTNNVWKITNQFEPVNILDPVANTQLKIFPNPTANSCIIQLDKNVIGETYFISTILGEISESGTINSTEVKVDMLNWPSGIYVISIEGKNHVSALMVKQ